MNIKKESLDFLSVYTLCADTKSTLGDKLFIVNKEGTLSFMQFSFDAALFCQLNVDKEEEFTLVYPTQTFVSFIAKAPEVFELKKDGVYFNGAKYSIDVCDSNLPDNISEYANIINESPEEVFTLKNLSSAYNARNFCGVDALGTVALQSNCFVASDMILAYIADTENNLKAEKDDEGIEKTKIYIPQVILNIFEKEKLESIEIKSYPSKNYWYYNHKNLHCVIPHHFDYEDSFPNLVKGSNSSSYMHKNYIVVGWDEFHSVIGRVGILAKNNPYSRIFLTITDKELIVENRDRNISVERILLKEISSASVITDKNSEECQIVLSSDYVTRILNKLNGDDVFIYVPENKEQFNSVRFEDEKHDVRIVHVLYDAA